MASMAYSEPFLKEYDAACERLYITPQQQVIAAARGLDAAASPDSTERGPLLLIDNATLGSRGVEAVVAGMTSVPLASLVLGNAYAADEGAELVAQTISTSLMSTTLTTVSLRGNGIRSAAPLGLILASVTQLVSLDASCNKLGLDTASFAAFCSTAQIHQNLETLNLNNNLLGSTGAGAGTPIADMIAGNRTIRNLDLSWNALSREAPAIAANLAKSNGSLVVCAIEGSSFNRHDSATIEAKLRANQRSAWEVDRRSAAEQEVRAKLAATQQELATALSAMEDAVRRAALADESRDVLQLQNQVLQSACAIQSNSSEARHGELSTDNDSLRQKLTSVQDECERRLKEAHTSADEAMQAASTARLSQEKASKEHTEEAQQLRSEISKLTSDRDEKADKIAALEKIVERGHEDFQRQTEEFTAKRRQCVDLETQLHGSKEEVARRTAELKSKEEELEAVRKSSAEQIAKNTELGERVRQLQEAVAAVQATHDEAVKALEDKHKREVDDLNGAAESKAAVHAETVKAKERAYQQLSEELAATREKHTQESIQSAEERAKLDAIVTELESQVAVLRSEAHVGELERRKSEHARQLATERAEQLQQQQDRVADRLSAKHEAVERQLQSDLTAIQKRAENESRRAQQLELEVNSLQGQIGRMRAAARKSKEDTTRRMMQQMQRAMMNSQTDGEESDGGLAAYGGPVGTSVASVKAADEPQAYTVMSSKSAPSAAVPTVAASVQQQQQHHDSSRSTSASSTSNKYGSLGSDSVSAANKYGSMGSETAKPSAAQPQQNLSSSSKYGSLGSDSMKAGMASAPANTASSKYGSMGSDGGSTSGSNKAYGAPESDFSANDRSSSVKSTVSNGSSTASSSSRRKPKFVSAPAAAQSQSQHDEFDSLSSNATSTVTSSDGF